MKKKLIALTLSLAMLASLLAGCGPKEPAADSPSAPPSQGQGDGPQDSQTPVVDTSKKITFTYFRQADDVTQREVEINPITNYWEDMFNLEIEWQLPPQRQRTEHHTGDWVG